jgi:hypothetical protein
MDNVLEQVDFSDFYLSADVTSVWITVDSISVYVRRSTSGEAVAVDLYPVGMEMDDPICGTWATFQEAEERIKDNEDELGTGDDGRREAADRSSLGHRENGNEEGTERGD